MTLRIEEMTRPMNRPAASGLDFTIQIDATRDLAADADRVEAVITVETRHRGAGSPVPRIAEVLIMDRSMSMMSHNKIGEARRAACAAIDALPDGAHLGIIAGNFTAETVFPPAGGFAAIDAKTRAAAKGKVRGLRPEGGTRIGQWLAAADEVFASGPTAGAVRHAVLYTDGKNEHETRAALDDALGACADQFVCDVRGVPGDWDYAELLHIADALHGDATAVLEIADLAGDFTRLMRRVQRLAVPRAYLRLGLSGPFSVAAISQTHPSQADLIQQPGDGGGGGTVIDVPLGSWEQEEARRYQLSLRFDPATVPTGEEVRASRVEIVAELADGTRRTWTGEPLLIRRHITPGDITVVPQVITQIEAEREITYAMQACVNAWLAGHAADADDELNEAIRLARESGDRRISLLESVAIFDADGRARLRPDVTHSEMQRLGLHSTKTGRPVADVPPGDPPPGAAADRHADEAGETHVCAACGEPAYDAEQKICENCGRPFADRGVS
jgi:Mg-chelatase subunit ChlD